jgi:hypothetical protein
VNLDDTPKALKGQEFLAVVFEGVNTATFGHDLTPGFCFLGVGKA